MSVHLPVLAREVIDLLTLQPGMTVVDGTMGGGGHTILLAQAVGREGRVVAVDRDPSAVEAARSRLQPLGIEPLVGNYADLPALLASISIDAVDAILLDLGLSSDQLADPRRGFSFQSSGELDMRFDPRGGEAAWELLARLSEKDLADVIFQYGEERYSRRIARRIVEARRRQPLRTVPQLAEIVRRCVPRSRGHAIDPATRTFQALRIAVNDELRGLDQAVEPLANTLRPGGRLAIISFHSLEDRIVKRRFRESALLEVVTKKPVQAAADEAQANPRSRSAKLRVAERINVVGKRTQ